MGWASRLLATILWIFELEFWTYVGVVSRDQGGGTRGSLGAYASVGRWRHTHPRSWEGSSHVSTIGHRTAVWEMSIYTGEPLGQTRVAAVLNHQLGAHFSWGQQTRSFEWKEGEL